MIKTDEKKVQKCNILFKNHQLRAIENNLKFYTRKLNLNIKKQNEINNLEAHQR